MTSAITLVIGEGTGAAISGILVTLATIFMMVVRFWIHEVRGKVTDVAATTDDTAKLAAIAAGQTIKAHEKLDSIKETSEKAAQDVDGNLTAVREELKKSMALNEAQAASILSLRDTIATLTDIVKQQRTQSRSTDVKS